jgi:hypothetical protein
MLVLPSPPQRGEGNISNPRVLSDMGLAIPTLRDSNNNSNYNYYNKSQSERTHGFELSLFEDYLRAQNKRNIRQLICYSRKYRQVLESGNAGPLLNLSSAKRLHVMEALAAYAKYMGIYEKWQQIRKLYSLKWTSENASLVAMQRFFNPSLSLDNMLSQIKNLIALTPSYVGNIIKFGVLTGLRASEIIESVRLINDKEVFPMYYDPVAMTLSHWKMPGMLRSTKKAFLSYVTPEMIEHIQNPEKIPTYNAIRKICNKRGISCDLHLCRKIFASHLHHSGISDITVDMLQGRVPKSVLAQHYVTPNNDLRDKILDSLHKLEGELEK